MNQYYYDKDGDIYTPIPTFMPIDGQRYSVRYPLTSIKNQLYNLIIYEMVSQLEEIHNTDYDPDTDIVTINYQTRTIRLKPECISIDMHGFEPTIIKYDDYDISKLL